MRRQKLPPERDAKSDKFIPNDASNRARAQPEVAEIPGPPYHIDLGAIQLADYNLGDRPRIDPLWSIDFLTRKLQDPTFHLEPICRSCEIWIPQKAKPLRKGAVDNLQGCNGCLYSMLNGTKGGTWASTARDAAFGAWASAKRDIAKLELLRSKTIGELKRERLQRKLEKAHARLKQTVKRCKRLGFAPSMPIRAQEEWERPFLVPTRDARRKTEARDRKEQAPSPSCRNCWHWEEERALSEREKRSIGRCWVQDGVQTKAKYWCREHSLRMAD